MGGAKVEQDYLNLNTFNSFVFSHTRWIRNFIHIKKIGLEQADITRQDLS